MQYGAAKYLQHATIIHRIGLTTTQTSNVKAIKSHQQGLLHQYDEDEDGYNDDECRCKIVQLNAHSKDCATTSLFFSILCNVLFSAKPQLLGYPFEVKRTTLYGTHMHIFYHIHTT